MLVLTINVSNKSGLSLERDRRLKASEAVHFEGEKREEVLRLGERCVGEQNRDELGRMARNWCGGIGKKVRQKNSWVDSGSGSLPSE